MEAISLLDEDEEVDARSIATASNGHSAQSAIEIVELGESDDADAEHAGAGAETASAGGGVSGGGVSGGGGSRTLVAGTCAHDPLDLDATSVVSSQRSHCYICDRSLRQPGTSDYMLDECSHWMHRHCLEQHVGCKLKRMLASQIGCPVCAKTLSVRDVHRLSSGGGGRGSCAPSTTGGRSTSSAGGSASGGSAKRARSIDEGAHASDRRVRGSGAATKRIYKELQAIQGSDARSHGFSVEVSDECNLYVWEVCFFGFERGTPLANDLARVPDSRIHLRVNFPSNFPEAPPYIRVVRPRFKFRTGHVTIGGSICTEMLTTHGWSPSMTMESAILSIRMNMITGGARIETNAHGGDYSEMEAKHAFDRMVREHGWY